MHETDDGAMIRGARPNDRDVVNNRCRMRKHFGYPRTVLPMLAELAASAHQFRAFLGKRVHESEPLAFHE
jgi:hypothetical protein